MANNPTTVTTNQVRTTSKGIGPVTTNVGIGTAIMAVLVWAVSDLGGVEVPGDVVAAGAFLISVLIGYFTKGRKDVEETVVHVPADVPANVPVVGNNVAENQAVTNSILSKDAPTVGATV